MPRFLFILLGFTFLFAPLFAGAQEAPELPFDLPVYLFIVENGDVLGVASISENVAVGCLAAAKTPNTADCFLGYANPHAATSVNGIPYTYDNNGNLASDGVRTYVWDYRNKIASIAKDIITHTYTYNHEGERVSSSDGTTTTIYPNKLSILKRNVQYGTK